MQFPLRCTPTIPFPGICQRTLNLPPTTDPIPTGHNPTPTRCTPAQIPVIPTTPTPPPFRTHTRAAALRPPCIPEPIPDGRTSPCLGSGHEWVMCSYDRRAAQAIRCGCCGNIGGSWGSGAWGGEALAEEAEDGLESRRAFPVIEVGLGMWLCSG